MIWHTLCQQFSSKVFFFFFKVVWCGCVCGVADLCGWDVNYHELCSCCVVLLLRIFLCAIAIDQIKWKWQRRGWSQRRKTRKKYVCAVESWATASLTPSPAPIFFNSIHTHTPTAINLKISIWLKSNERNDEDDDGDDYDYDYDDEANALFEIKQSCEEEEKKTKICVSKFGLLNWRRWRMASNVHRTRPHPPPAKMGGWGRIYLTQIYNRRTHTYFFLLLFARGFFFGSLLLFFVYRKNRILWGHYYTAIATPSSCFYNCISMQGSDSIDSSNKYAK